MKREYYVTPKPSPIMKFFWTAAGADHFILERATYSDQIKYMCLGGIVVATGVMAAIAGGYAFYTIFEPRGSAIESQFHLGVALASMLFGCVWGLMIFNIDRFIVTSTGKGDGTEAITWEEFKGAIPRIVMGAIIALTISKPVEIRMFKTEIDTALHEEQLKLQKDYEVRTRANFEGRIKLIDDELNKLEGGKNDLIQKINKATQELTDQLQGRAGAPAGDGKLSQALRNIKEKVGCRNGRRTWKKQKSCKWIRWTAREDKISASHRWILDFPFHNTPLYDHRVNSHLFQIDACKNSI